MRRMKPPTALDVVEEISEPGAEVLAQVVHDAHGVGDVALGAGDAAPGGAGADGDDGGGAGGEAVEPLEAGDLATGLGVFAQAHPVAVAGDGLVHDRALPR